jgi:hypothetical protein
MARFLLTEKQYMNVGDEWEQVETAPNGRQMRHRYAVGTLLDPEDPSQHNAPEGIIVSTKASPQHPRDLLFKGPPNQGMSPLDSEAEALLASVPQGMNPMGEEAFPTIPVPQPTRGDPLADIKAQLAQLAGAVADLSGENAELKRRLAERPEEDEAPLPPPPTPAQAAKAIL